MQKIQIILGILFFSTLLFFGCSKEEGLSPEQMRYGKADTISLGFAFLNAEPEQVKAPVNVTEVAVNNVNVYVFNERGDVISHRYAIGGTSLSGLVIYRDMRYRIYAIANAGESLPCRTVAEVEALTRRIGNISQVVDASGGVLMSGKTAQMLLANGQQVSVEMVRCVSKFILKCDYSQLNPGVKVTVKRVQLKNAPAEICLFGNNKAIGGAVIDGEERIGSDLDPLSGAGAAFYLFENLQGIVAPAALDNKSKVQQMNTMAKANSSYIEMEYDYLSPEKTGTIVYRFYLGKTFADCDVKRNTQYTCSVLFKGNGSAGENSWSVDNSGLIDRVTGIVLNPTKHTFKALGETLQIQATVLPATADNALLSWSSSNPNVATVNASGVVTAVTDGSCTIVAISTDGTQVSASCSMLVDSKVLVSSVSIDPTTLTLFSGEFGQLTATVLPANATVPEVVWSSSNTSVATVDGTGKVRAIAAGTVDITGMSVDDNAKKAVCKVTVKNQKLTIDPLSKTLYVGENFTIHYALEPPVLPSFSSSSPAVATVDANGKVTAVGNGTANITVSAHGLSAVCSVTVVQPEISFPYASKVMFEGEELWIPYAKLVPNTAIPTTNSSAVGVIEILETTSKGVKVKAHAAGNATLTATVAGVRATCAITVVNVQITANDLVVYTNFNENLAYTLSYPISSGVKCELVDAVDAAYVTIVRGESSSSSTPFILQGKTATAKEIRLKLSLVDMPGVSTIVKCVVKPGFEVTDADFLAGNISILANHTVRNSNNFSNQIDKVFSRYSVSHTKAPRAIIHWRCNKNDLKVRDGNVIYTEQKTTANGPGYYITLSVTGDNGVTMEYTNSRALTVYESITTHIEGHGTYMYNEEVNGVERPLFNVTCEVILVPELPGAPIRKEVDEANLKFRGHSFGTFGSFQHGKPYQIGYDIYLYTPVINGRNELVTKLIFNGIYQYYNSNGEEYPDEWVD